MRLNQHRTLVPPVLLLALTAMACSSGDGKQPSDVDVIRTVFPEQAEQVLSGQRAWQHQAEGYRVEASTSPWQPAKLSALVAERSEEGMSLRAGDELSLHIKELKAHGKVSLVEDALSYARSDGSAYWVGLPGGLEEWLLIEQDVKDAQVPVASWQVEGGWLQQQGPQVLISSEPGAPARVAVSAPFAYGPNGKSLEVRLAVNDQRIELFVEPSAGPLLIDPIWVDFSMMLQPQFFHAAGLLGDGNVIVTGGETQGGPTSFSTLYNTAAGTWGAAPFSLMRTRLTATSLMDGSVLFAGGDDGFSALDDVTAYVAGVGFQQRPFMIEPRASHTATRLNDGRVMVCGGQPGGSIKVGKSGGFGALDSCEIYDPMMAIWQFTPPMNLTRQGHAAVTLQDGRVMQCGGLDEFDFFLDNCEMFDPSMPANGWAFMPSFGGPRANPRLTLLANGMVLMTGGEFQGTPINAAQVFNPMTSTWTAVGTMTTPRVGHTASLLTDGQVLVAGGYNTNFQSLPSASLFNPATNMFTATTPISGARAFHTATTLQSGNVLVAGGVEINTFTPAVSSSVFVNQLPLGAPCTQITAPSCISGVCEDGVCCDTTCSGTCMACSVAAKGGGQEGVCEPVLAGNDPISECGQGTTCSMDGNDIDLPDTCDGAGSCMDGGVTDCGFFGCTEQFEVPECTTTCSSDNDCATDGYCDIPNGNCLGKGALGEPATNPNECLSGFVADGVCCDTACDLGQCDACTVAMGGTADGVCTPVTGLCDDNNPCTIDLCEIDGCSTESVLDGVPCPDGQCFAGQCVPDASTNAATTGATTSNGAGGGGTSTGAGAAGGDDNSFDLSESQLEGGGICTVTVASGHARRGYAGWMAAGLALALGALGRRRRRREEEEQQES